MHPEAQCRLHAAPSLHHDAQRKLQFFTLLAGLIVAVQAMVLCCSFSAPTTRPFRQIRNRPVRVGGRPAPGPR